MVFTEHLDTLVDSIFCLLVLRNAHLRIPPGVIIIHGLGPAGLFATTTAASFLANVLPQRLLPLATAALATVDEVLGRGGTWQLVTVLGLQVLAVRGELSFRPELKIFCLARNLVEEIVAAGDLVDILDDRDLQGRI